MAHSNVQHDAFLCVTWLICIQVKLCVLAHEQPCSVCAMTPSYMRTALFICATCTYACSAWCAPWLFHGYDVTWLSHRHASRDALISDTFLPHVTWLVHMCDVTHWYVWHDSFMRTSVFKCVYVRTYVYMRMYTCKFVCTSVCVYGCVCVRVSHCVSLDCCTCMYVCMCVCMYVYM